MNRYAVQFEGCEIKVLATDEQDVRRCFTHPEKIIKIKLVERGTAPHDLTTGCCES